MTMTGLPRAGRTSKPHDYQQNVQKMKNLLKNWALTGNSLKFSNQKKQKIHSSYGEQNKKATKAKTEQEPCSQEELNLSKIEKSFQNKTVRALQD